VKLESTRILDIEKFMPRESIDRLYWDMPYHLASSGKTGVEAFARDPRGDEEEGHGSELRSALKLKAATNRTRPV
jgi:hypothetical protein